jgi:hypothetical protein
LYHCLQNCKTLEKSLSLLQESDLFAHGAARTEIIAQVVEGTTEACRRFNGSKATHRIIPLFDSTMILLQPISEICTRAMLDIAAPRLAYGTGIGSMAISCHLIGNRANHSNRLCEKLLSRFPISLLAQHGINQIAIIVDRPIHITPLPMHLDVRLIDIPGFPGLPLSLDA